MAYLAVQSESVQCHSGATVPVVAARASAPQGGGEDIREPMTEQQIPCCFCDWSLTFGTMMMATGNERREKGRNRRGTGGCRAKKEVNVEMQIREVG